MTTTNVNFRLDKREKQEIESFCEDVGMNLTTLITVFIRYVNRNHKLPFALEVNEPNEAYITPSLDFSKYRTNQPHFSNSADIDQYFKELRDEERY